jgi:hypothetical protein
MPGLSASWAFSGNPTLEAIVFSPESQSYPSTLHVTGESIGPIEETSHDLASCRTWPFFSQQCRDSVEGLSPCRNKDNDQVTLLLAWTLYWPAAMGRPQPPYDMYDLTR